MILIVGLGNPGEKYNGTRHNIGFVVVKEFQKENNFPEFHISKKFNALISERTLDKEQMVLVLPETYMNNSGKSVKILAKSYKLEARSLIIVHDDIDLPLETIRLSIGRGAAGHKGVESIIKEFKTKDFIRVRIGICPLDFKPKNIEKFVLKKLDKKESEKVKEIVKKSRLAIETIIKEGFEKAIQKYST